MDLLTRISSIIAMGDVLLPYSSQAMVDPQSKDKEAEDILMSLKLSKLVIDGYEILLHYHKTPRDGGGSFISVQFHGTGEPFLPFNLVVKVAKLFMTGETLYLAEALKSGRKIYCWMALYDEDDESIENPLYDAASEPMSFEGFRYKYLNPSEIEFF